MPKLDTVAKPVTVFEELLAAARTDPNFQPDNQAKDEEPAAFLERLAVAISSVSTEVWNNLSEDKAQVWYNQAAEEKSAFRLLTFPMGYDGKGTLSKTPITYARRDALGRGIINNIRRIVLMNPKLTIEEVQAELIASGRDATTIKENTLWVAYTDARSIIALAKELGKWKPDEEQEQEVAA